MGLFDSVKDVAKKGLGYVDAVGKADPQVIALVNTRLTEQDKWNDLFSTKLIELLDKNDSVRAEIKERLDQIAAASRSQKELVHAAGEYRAFTSEYESAIGLFNGAREKFVEAEKIMVSAAELRATATDYKNAEGRLEHARLLHEEASKKYAEAKQVLTGLEARAEQIVSDVKAFADAAVQAKNASAQSAERAETCLSDAKQSLQDSNAKLIEAKTVFETGANELRLARNQHDDARTALKCAKTTLDSAEARYLGTQKTAADAAESLKRAEGLANRSEEGLNKAIENAEKAKANYYKAKDSLRNAARFAVVSLMAALSIAAWSATQAISTGRFVALVPILTTALAVGFGVYAWRKAL